jgi:hypothetical protein
VAEHFLTHTDYPPANEAFYFVLEAVGDEEAALLLIRALTVPLRVESGPLIGAGERSRPREREVAEVGGAIEAVLVNEPVSRSARVSRALGQAIATSRERPGGAGRGIADRALALLAKCRAAEATQLLTELAEDPEPSFRALAIQAMGELGAGGADGEEARARLLLTLRRALGTDPDPQVRRESAVAIGRLGAAEGVEMLRESLRSERTLVIPRRTRRAGVLGVAAMAAWAVWSLFLSQVRELPPPPLHFLTLSSIAFAAAGSVSAGITLLASALPAWARPLLAGAAAGVLGFVLCAWSRWTHRFPIGGEGWELIFEPVGSGVLAAMAATVLVLGEVLVGQSLSTPRATAG